MEGREAYFEPESFIFAQGKNENGPENGTNGPEKVQEPTPVIQWPEALV